MSFNGPFARSRLLRARNYVAGKGFMERVGWKRSAAASLLIETNTGSVTNSLVEEAYCIVVGEVSDHKLYTSPIGSYNPNFNTFTTAKFQLTLLAPDDVDFAPDFERALTALFECQKAIAIGEDMRYFIIEDVPGRRSLRFSAPLMTMRPEPVIEGGKLDSDTADWPVTAEHKEAFDLVKHTHQVLPMMVYDERNKFVGPREVSGKIRGSLVEVHFRLKHYFIGGGQDRFNSFTGIIEQIVILKPAIANNISPYRSRARDGPIRPKAVTPSRSEMEGAANAFIPNSGDDEVPGTSSQAIEAPNGSVVDVSAASLVESVPSVPTDGVVGAVADSGGNREDMLTGGTTSIREGVRDNKGKAREEDQHDMEGDWDHVDSEGSTISGESEVGGVKDGGGDLEPSSPKKRKSKK
ncbi:hypothetical protein Hypma_015882 [Hypsizygus marmoreus]|uniref:Uncharacterized protein n=1 Tax=Hypsizygus marmoreus TaxID=39966 RepID=A0A369K1X2_HYPMA|nr:hypothetical protein Hypma_015882 [Hypsizygus marmoreus]